MNFFTFHAFGKNGVNSLGDVSLVTHLVVRSMLKFKWRSPCETEAENLSIDAVRSHNLGEKMNAWGAEFRCGEH